VLLEQLAFEQLHIDIARNASDDFNPFHDSERWNKIRGNPFRAPIVLGFQLEFLASDRILKHRANEALAVATDESDVFRNFEFNFAGGLRPGEQFELEVRKTINKRAKGGGLSNRVVVRKCDGTPVLIGTQSDTPTPRVDTDMALLQLPPLADLADRSTLPGQALFLKRKYMNTSNAKNFALGALCRQQDYIDELDEKIQFSPLFPASLMSCALLERGLAMGHDFEVEPMVYTSHQISVDLRVQARLRSNDRVHILVAPPEDCLPGKGLGKACVDQQLFRCAGIAGNGAVLFNARLQLAPLQALAGLKDR
jgi:hypothetical protein